MSSDFLIPRPPIRAGKLAWVQALSLTSTLVIWLKEVLTISSNSWSRSASLYAGDDLRRYVSLGIAIEFFSRTNAWCGSISSSLETIRFSASFLDLISFRIPGGANGEPKTTVSSIEVILRFGSSFLKVAMTGKGSSQFRQVSSHLPVFMDSPIFSSSLKRKRRSSKTI